MSTNVSIICTLSSCELFGTEITFPASLKVGDGERILCGVCGSTTEFVGEARPITIPLTPLMNRDQPPVTS